ncbi:TolC family protein [Chondromyces crocatus]|uniref:TolC family protein n=1 Tax=Chondromyces crocatus TaxID=52 RepID=UPI00147053D2|nr:TolC family protein [Chondromyces crocatus]
MSQGRWVPHAKAITLSEALRFARAHNPSLHLARARVKAALVAAEAPGAQWLPSVNGTAQLFGATMNNSTAAILANNGVSLPRVGATRIATQPDLAPYASSLVAVGARQQLFDFGRIAAQSAALDAQTELARRMEDGAQLDVSLQVAEAFHAVRAARSVEVAAREAAGRASAHREAARAGVEAGLRTPVDVARAEAEVARFDVAQVRAEGALAAAQALLAAVVGVPEQALDAGGGGEERGTLPPFSELLQRARRQSVEVRQAEAQVEVSRAETRALEAQLRPDLALAAALSGRAGGAPPTNGETIPGYGFAPIVPNWSVGVVLNVPLHDPTIKARRDALREIEVVKAAELGAARLAQIAAVRQAYIATETAQVALLALDRAAISARANHAQAEARFEAGLGTVLELIDAEAVRVEAEVQRAIGEFEAARARVLLDRVVAEAR